MFQICLYMDQVKHLYHRTENVSLGRRKKRNCRKISITRNKITQDPDNQSKKSKVGSSIDGTKIHVELTPPPNKNKQDYTGDTTLGGDDFDKVLVTWLVKEFEEREGIKLTQDIQALQRLTEAAEYLGLF